MHPESFQLNAPSNTYKATDIECQARHKKYAQYVSFLFQHTAVTHIAKHQYVFFLLSNTAVTRVAEQPKERDKYTSFLFAKRVDVTLAAKQPKHP
ncbi:hypothetical protein NDU88_003658 [Pleurodeles waltl]|uniref:Uncharacterized protein n=1 Tax=Pleurodeles waltl TaxID=8319 RepID=A0AAV7T5Y2_PLEWA|nr:hypothetical protein NDU88_003658 [Pleurodeles waltl]